MSLFTKCAKPLVICFAFLAAFSVTVVYAVMDPRYELDTHTLDAPSPGKHGHRGERRAVGTHAGTASSASGRKDSVYTVKPGDNLYKILMREYGLTNDEADAVVAEVRRENGINDIRRLRIGQRIVIPQLHGKEPVRAKSAGQADEVLEPAAQGKDTSPVIHAFRLAPPPMSKGQETVARIRKTWDSIVPSQNLALKTLVLKSSNFSLTLDPKRYPMFSSMDGARILLDQHGAIPPLVKTLIENNGSAIRIVSESPVHPKRFLAAMLGAAGFYSVEENFDLQFGVDPKLTVHADFKVEKTPDSLIKQDVVLMNCGKSALPTSLDAFLKKEGFSVYEPFAATGTSPLPRQDNRILQIADASQSAMVDALLNALDISWENDQHIDVFAADNNGISLSVKADRYFERGGQRYVVTSYNDDAITYTLFQILEARGYKVIMLEKRDDFRKVMEKTLSQLRIQGRYAQYDLRADRDPSYSLQMSGFKLEGPGVPGNSLFLTNLALDRIIRDLLKENGYSIHVK